MKRDLSFAKCMLFARLIGAPANALRADAAGDSRLALVSSVFSRLTADLPGASVTVLQGESITFAAGYGSADLRFGSPITLGQNSCLAPSRSSSRRSWSTSLQSSIN